MSKEINDKNNNYCNVISYEHNTEHIKYTHSLTVSGACSEVGSESAIDNLLLKLLNLRGFAIGLACCGGTTLIYSCVGSVFERGLGFGGI